MQVYRYLMLIGSSKLLPISLFIFPEHTQWPHFFLHCLHTEHRGGLCQYYTFKLLTPLSMYESCEREPYLCWCLSGRAQRNSISRGCHIFLMIQKGLQRVCIVGRKYSFRLCHRHDIFEFWAVLAGLATNFKLHIPPQSEENFLLGSHLMEAWTSFRTPWFFETLCNPPLNQP